MSSRYYLFPENSPPLKISTRILEGLIHGTDSIPEYANSEQRVLGVSVEHVDGEPVRIIGSAGSIWIFDKEGRINEGLRKSFDMIMSSPDFPIADESKVVSLQSRLNKKTHKRLFRWDATKADLDLIAKDLWPQTQEDRLKPVISISKRKPPLTYEAERALDEISDTFTTISIRLGFLKGPTLKGLAAEARERSLIDLEHQSLYRAVAEMAEERMEILRRRNQKKGVWYAVLRIHRLEDGISEEIARFDVRCTNRDAAEKATQRLLVEHANKFSTGLMIEAEMLTDIEWSRQNPAP